MPFEPRRIVVYCKTYPELSSKHRETVCTAGIDLNTLMPIRLWPVPLRLLEPEYQYELYDILELPIERNFRDPRPESHRIRVDGIKRIGHLDTEHAWEARREVMFGNADWYYACLEHLKAAQAQSNTSLGIVPVAEVARIEVAVRPTGERAEHEERMKHRVQLLDLFDEDTRRRLDFLPFRIRIHWSCGVPGKRTPGCPGHTASIIDWGLLELGRREGVERARQKMLDLTDLERYDLHLLVGNFFTHPATFGVIGLWYPPRGGWQDQHGLWSNR